MNIYKLLSRHLKLKAIIVLKAAVAVKAVVAVGGHNLEIDLSIRSSINFISFHCYGSSS